MGAFYGSVQVRSIDRNAVKAAVEGMSRTLENRCLVGPEINGWIGVYPSMNGQDERVGAALAAQIDADVLHLLVHDDDVFAYWLYRGGQLVDSYWSLPGYFTEEHRAAQEALCWNPAVFRPILGDKADRLSTLLARGEEQELSATEQLEEFAKALKIANVETAYEYLKDGETEGIKKWKQFEEVPAEQVAADKQTARQLRKEVETARKQLKSEGVLLVHDERKDQLRPYGSAIGAGFIVGWANHGTDTVDFVKYEPPWGAPDTIQLETSKHVTALASDASHRRLGVAGGKMVHVFEKRGDDWARLADIPEKDLSMGVTFSADGKIVAHASREDFAVTEIEGGRQIRVPATAGVRKSAFHPSNEWLAVGNGSTFGLISLREAPDWREIFVGGKNDTASQAAAAVARTFQEFDFVEAERMQRVEMEKMIKKLQKGSGKGKAQGMSDADIQQFRDSMEQSIQEMKTRMADWKAGRLPEVSPQSTESVWCVGFSRDGRWMWCGGNSGIAVYEWEKVPREVGSVLVDPVWRIEFSGDPNDFVSGTRVWAAAEEVDSNAIVFTGSSGSLYRLELGTGEMRELIKLPGDAWVMGLEMSADGTALGMSVGTMLFTESARKHHDRSWAWEVWSYPKLRARTESRSD